MQKTVLLYFALLLWFVVPSQAQLTLSLPQLEAEIGEEITVDLTMENADSVVVTQFSFRWDTDVLEFVDTANIIFHDWQPDLESNLMQVDSGYFVIAWSDFTFAGLTLTEPTAFMQLTFKVVGEKGDSSALEFSDNPIPVIAGTVAGEIPTIINGWVKIPGGTSTTDTKEFGWEIEDITPNPFQTTAIIDFNIPRTEEVVWSIFDVSGRTIFEETKRYNAGQNQFFLEQQILPANGTYFVQLRTADFITTQKVDLIK